MLYMEGGGKSIGDRQVEFFGWGGSFGSRQARVLCFPKLHSCGSVFTAC